MKRRQRALAWSVHILTASGAVFGLLALVATAEHAWRLAFAWMGVTMLIDSIDGGLARVAKVKHALPGFDGALLDNIVDYFTYTVVPAFFIFEAGLVPHGWNTIIAMAVLFASAYQFAQTNAKTEDHTFLGFPSYWNVVVAYLFLLEFTPALNLAVLLLFSVLAFVPLKYLYPSRTPLLRPLNVGLTAVWGILMAAALVRYPDGYRVLVYLSLLYVVYYFLFSGYLSFRRRPLPAPR